MDGGLLAATVRDAIAAAFVSCCQGCCGSGTIDAPDRNPQSGNRLMARRVVRQQGACRLIAAAAVDAWMPNAGPLLFGMTTRRDSRTL